MRNKNAVGYWANLYGDRLLALLLLAKGEITNEQAVSIGDFTDVDGMMKFMETQIKRGHELKDSLKN